MLSFILHDIVIGAIIIRDFVQRGEIHLLHAAVLDSAGIRGRLDGSAR